jgi:hypothetical protein
MQASAAEDTAAAVDHQITQRGLVTTEEVGVALAAIDTQINEVGLYKWNYSV